ncbi:MAG: hypothetical protein EXS33_06925 [Pedosphaera sp.]|nr:hypothetical protein [Pedosphaera sp.]
MKLPLVWMVVLGGCLLTDGAAAADPSPPAPRRIFTWKDLSLPEYAGYISAMRATGCPENRIRDMIVGDINEMFDQERLQEAMAANVDWWKANPPRPVVTEPEAETRARRESLRAELITRHLGADRTNDLRLPPLVSGLKHSLTGPILGALPVEKHTRLINICDDYVANLKAYQMAHRAEGQPSDYLEEIKIRDEMRSQARTLLTVREYEEFLVHNSGHAFTLRSELRLFAPTEEEFRNIFATLDPHKVRMQQEYGIERALSPRQLAGYQKNCDLAVQEILPPERFKRYQLSRDPSYQQAFNVAARDKLEEKAALRLYQAYREQAGQREKITGDNAIPPEEKDRLVQSINQESERLLAELVAEKAGASKVP